SAGWVKHRCAANWKMLPENDSDGYHLGFVHRALLSTVRTPAQHVVGHERAIRAVIRDWGGGHIEIDWSPGYDRPFQWLGSVSGGAGGATVAPRAARGGPPGHGRATHRGPAHE